MAKPQGLRKPYVAYRKLRTISDLLAGIVEVAVEVRSSTRTNPQLVELGLSDISFNAETARRLVREIEDLGDGIDAETED